jgi:hypothetical protein
MLNVDLGFPLDECYLNILHIEMGHPLHRHL